MKKLHVKRALAALFALLMVVTTSACSDSNTSNQSNVDSQSQEVDSASVQLQVDSYSSDIFEEAGFEITVDGVRFPLPTTLNELGDRWHFDEDTVGLMTFDYYLEYTDILTVLTGATLFYDDREVSIVVLRDYDGGDLRNAQIVKLVTNVGTTYNNPRPPVLVNSAGVGSDYLALDDVFAGAGEYLEFSHGRYYRIHVGEYTIMFFASEKAIPNSEPPIDRADLVTGVDVCLSISDWPNSDVFSDNHDW